MDQTKKRNRDSSVELKKQSEKKARRTRQTKCVVKSSPPNVSCKVKDSRTLNFKHMPCSDFVLDYDTEPLENVYEMGKVIGEGQFGIVSEATHLQSGMMFACKSISKSTLTSRSDRADVVREMEIMAMLRDCPQIVSLESSHEDENWIHIVMELCNGGELFDEINRVSSFSENISAQIFHQLVMGVLHCHERGILHHDLKPENILLCDKRYSMDETPTVKIADFGLAMALSPLEKIKGRSGSPFYMAPEVIDGVYGLSSDIWSLGVILYILLSGSPPFFGDDDESTYRAIASNDLKFNGSKWRIVSEEAKNLIRQMLQTDASKRPTVFDLLNHPWISVFCSPPSSPSSPSDLCQTQDSLFSPANYNQCNFIEIPSTPEFPSRNPELNTYQAYKPFWSNSPLPETFSPITSFSNSSLSSIDLSPHPTYDSFSFGQGREQQPLDSKSLKMIPNSFSSYNFYTIMNIPKKKRSKRFISASFSHVSTL